MSELWRIVFGPPTTGAPHTYIHMESEIRKLRKGLKLAREMWLEENDPKDGTDVVTPFDEYLY